MTNDENESQTYIYISTHGLLLSRSAVWFILILNLIVIMNNHQQVKSERAREKENITCSFPILRNRWLRRSEILGWPSNSNLDSSIYIIIVFYTRTFLFSFIFDCLQMFWEIQLAVQIFKINFHSFVYETIHERWRLVCVYILKNNKSTISFVYSTFLWLRSITERKFLLTVRQVSGK